MLVCTGSSLLAMDIRDALKLKAPQHVRPALFMGCNVCADDRGPDPKGGVVVDKFKVCSRRSAAVAVLQAGEFNVLVSTGVVEENLDVGELSLIVYYELAVRVLSGARHRVRRRRRLVRCSA